MKEILTTGPVAILLKSIGYFFRAVWICYQILLGTVLVLVVLAAFWVADFVNYFEIRSLKKNNPDKTAFMRAEEERIRSDAVISSAVLGDRTRRGRKELIWQQWLPWDSIPGLVKNISIIAEDGKFFQHNGFDLEQIEYAFVVNRQKGKRFRGASTISQQVVKNLYLGSEKSYSRKLREAAMTALLEGNLSKERILEIYLNIAQFGPGVFGVRAGSQYHFGKVPGELSFQEVVNLMAVLPKPSQWRPGSQSLVYVRHKLRIGRNLSLYKSIRRKIPDDEYRAFLEYATAEEEVRWSKLRDREAVLPHDSTGALEPAEGPRDKPDSSHH